MRVARGEGREFLALSEGVCTMAETIVGGLYIGEDGRLQDAEGRLIVAAPESGREGDGETVSVEPVSVEPVSVELVSEPEPEPDAVGRKRRK